MYLFAVKAAVCQIALSSLYWDRLWAERGAAPLYQHSLIKDISEDEKNCLGVEEWNVEALALNV